MLTTIAAHAIQPGDLILTAAASLVEIRAVETYAGTTHALQRESGALVPTAYTFPADAPVRRYSAR
jgi:hypothetical protein